MSRKRLPIVPHLPPEQIVRRYRSCRNGIEKTHWQVLWLLTRPEEPLTPAQAAHHVGLTAGWVRTLLKRWNVDGPDGLADRRAVANGGHPKLSPAQQAELYEVLQQPPSDGGLWTGTRVVAYVHDRWGVAVGKPTGWKWLRRPGFTLQVPRPRHPEAASPAEQRVWKSRPRRSSGRVAAAAPGPVGRVVGRG
jgi:transposase